MIIPIRRGSDKRFTLFIKQMERRYIVCGGIDNHETPLNLESLTIELFVRHEPCGEIIPVPHTLREDKQAIHFEFTSAMQEGHGLGDYTLIAKIKTPDGKFLSRCRKDTIEAPLCEVVHPTAEVDDTPEDTIDMWLLDAIRGEKGDKGEDGKPFTYEDFTMEQLMLLRGRDGQDGRDGRDGKMPLIRIDAETGEWEIDGVRTGHSAKGEKGDKGEPLRFEDLTPEQVKQLQTALGASGSATPSVDAIKQALLSDPTAVAKLKGERGERGEQGIQGLRGERGEKGQDGRDGTGATAGTAPTAEEVKRAFIADPTALALLKGEKGEAGERGRDGQNGISPSVEDIKQALLNDPQAVAKLKGEQGSAGAGSADYKELKERFDNFLKVFQLLRDQVTLLQNPPSPDDFEPPTEDNSTLETSSGRLFTLIDFGGMMTMRYLKTPFGNGIENLGIAEGTTYDVYADNRKLSTERWVLEENPAEGDNGEKVLVPKGAELKSFLIGGGKPTHIVVKHQGRRIKINLSIGNQGIRLPEASEVEVVKRGEYYIEVTRGYSFFRNGNATLSVVGNSGGELRLSTKVDETMVSAKFEDHTLHTLTPPLRLRAVNVIGTTQEYPITIA